MIQSPPHKDKIEQGILAICFHHPQKILHLLAEKVNEEYFHTLIWKKTFVALHELYEESKRYDLLLLINRVQQLVEDKNDAELRGGIVASRMTELSSTLGVTENFNKYLAELKETYWQRKAFYYCYNNLDKNKFPNIEKLKADLVEMIDGINDATTSGDKTEIKTTQDIATDFEEDLHDKIKNDTLPGLSTGLYDLDYYMGGLRKKQLWIIGGQSSSGKSILAGQMAHACLEQKKHVGFISLEMSGREVMGRMVSLDSRMNYDIIYNPHKYNLKNDKDKLMIIDKTLRKLEGYDLKVDEEGGHRMEDIDTVIARMEKDKPIDVLFIDHMHLLTTQNTENKRHLELNKISSMCKNIAMRKKIPIIVPCQLNEDNKIADARGVIRDADVAIFIEPDKLWVEKNRNGQRHFHIDLKCYGNLMRFMTKQEP